jgi:hypothetical protein
LDAAEKACFTASEGEIGLARLSLRIDDGGAGVDEPTI